MPFVKRDDVKLIIVYLNNLFWMSDCLKVKLCWWLFQSFEFKTKRKFSSTDFLYISCKEGLNLNRARQSEIESPITFDFSCLLKQFATGICSFQVVHFQWYFYLSQQIFGFWWSVKISIVHRCHLPCNISYFSLLCCCGILVGIFNNEIF